MSALWEKWFVKKNTANYFNNQKKELLRLVNQNIDTFENIMNYSRTKNIKTITRKYNQASNINQEILDRIFSLRTQFKKTIIALPVVKTLPNFARPYIEVSNNKYRFKKTPRVFQMSKILTNLSVEKAKNAAAKALTNAAAKNTAAKNTAAKNAAAKDLTNAAAKNTVEKNAAAKNAVSVQAITNASKNQLVQAKQLKKELTNNAAVTNTVRQQLGTNGSGAAHLARLFPIN